MPYFLLSLQTSQHPKNCKIQKYQQLKLQIEVHTRRILIADRWTNHMRNGLGIHNSHPNLHRVLLGNDCFLGWTTTWKDSARIHHTIAREGISSLKVGRVYDRRGCIVPMPSFPKLVNVQSDYRRNMQEYRVDISGWNSDGRARPHRSYGKAKIVLNSNLCVPFLGPKSTCNSWLLFRTTACHVLEILPPAETAVVPN